MQSTHSSDHSVAIFYAYESSSAVFSCSSPILGPRQGGLFEGNYLFLLFEVNGNQQNLLKSVAKNSPVVAMEKQQPKVCSSLKASLTKTWNNTRPVT